MEMLAQSQSHPWAACEQERLRSTYFYTLILAIQWHWLDSEMGRRAKYNISAENWMTTPQNPSCLLFVLLAFPH